MKNYRLRLRPWFEQLLIMSVIVNGVLLVGHFEWWGPGNPLNIKLVITLSVLLVGALYLLCKYGSTNFDLDEDLEEYEDD